MLFVKLLAPFLIFLIAILQIGLDYKWYDKRTRKHRSTIRFLLYVIVLSAIVTILIVIDEHKTSHETQKELKTISKTLSETREEAKKERDILLERISSLSFEVASDETFKPLDPNVREIALGALDSYLKKGLEEDFIISIECQMGNRNRQLLAKELTELLNEAGINTKGPTSNMTFSRGILPTHRIKINPKDELLAQKLAVALGPMFRSKFTGLKDGQVRSGEIILSIFGDPLFHQDGTVTFK